MSFEDFQLVYESKYVNSIITKDFMKYCQQQKATLIDALQGNDFFSVKLLTIIK